MAKQRTLELNGRVRTLKQWAFELGIVPTTINKRLREGWSLERTLTTPRVPFGKNNERVLELDGRKQSIKAWARQHGLLPQTLIARLKSGMSLRVALKAPVAQVGPGRGHGTITHDGLTLTVGEWSRRLGIPRVAINYRLRVGHAVADVLTVGRVQHRNTVTRSTHRGVGPNFAQTDRDRRGSVAQDFV